MLYQSIFLLAVLPLSSAIFGLGRMQSVAATGRLFCNGMPASNVRVKLFDTDILWDSELAVSYSNPMGIFLLSGHKREFSNIDPSLYIYHRCNYHGACLKKSEIRIPVQYISEGRIPQFTANLGAIDLNGRFTSDSVDCIN